MSETVRVVQNRKPVHASITSEQISELVDQFYGRVRQDERLGPIFEKRIVGNWEPHLANMKTFWRSVLLRSGEYHGRPVPKHVQLTEVVTDDFRVWLRLFGLTVEEIFEPEAQPLIIAAAERIASSLWLAMGTNALDTPPNWEQS